jgi:hypothetical protein
MIPTNCRMSASRLAHAFACSAFALTLLLAFANQPARAELPSGANEKVQVIGSPAAVEVHPKALTLSGRRAMQQLVVTGRYADTTVRDLTPFAEYTLSNPKVVSVSPGGFAVPREDGAATLIIKVGTHTLTVPVTVKDFQKPRPVSFRHDMIAVLNVGGCNSGACHGTPSGKNGFKLSLRGYDPPADYDQLTHDIFGRRTSKLGPDESLIYLKALGRVSHEGGKRFDDDSIPAMYMHAWLAEGLKNDPANLPELKRVEVLPGDRVLNKPARWQQLAVQAHFANGEVRDVTRLTSFSSSDAGVAEVTSDGLVEFSQSGEVAILCRYLEEMVTVRITYLEPREGFAWTNPTPNNYVDEHTFAKLKMLNILPSDLCSDQEFIRRTYLDVCGILPTADEVQKFLDSKEANKRAKLIDALLDRPEYADFWTLKWSDVLRSTRKSIKVKGAHVFHQWLHDHIRKNTPVNKVTKELLTGTGSTFGNPAANYYRIARDPPSLAETTAQLFFGVRMQCAKCHNHPFEKWTQDDYYSLAAFFARVKLRTDYLEPDPKKKEGAEFVYVTRAGDVIQPRRGTVIEPRFLGGVTPKILPEMDRRQVLAEWLTSAQNPFFGKSVVNRIWYHVMGRGIVDPVDDFRDSNPSANDALLNALAQDFAKHNFDVKYILRTILNSKTYQFSAQTNKFNKDDNKYFSHAVTRLYTAEQLFDAICTVTEVPENFPGMPPGTRSTQLPDGEVNNAFLKTFGQPARELACECERENESNLAQALQLINGPAVNDRLRNPNNRIGKLLAKKLPDKQMLDELYLVTLARLPLPGEVDAALRHVQTSADKRRAWEDVLWALINSKEFLFRH